MSKLIKIPIKATLVWRAPAKYYFFSGQVPKNITEDEVLERVYKDVADFLRDNPALSQLEAYFNLDSSVDFEANGKLVASGSTTEDIEDEGDGRIEMIVEVSGEMAANHGPDGMRGWNHFEILEEMEKSGDIAGDPSRFNIDISYESRVKTA